MSKSMLFYNRQSVGQYVLVSEHHLLPATNYFLFHGNYLQIFEFLIMRRPLSWEEGSVIYSYNCHWALPTLPFSSSSPAEFETILYSLIWNEVLFCCSYYSQGYSGIIIAGLHKRQEKWSWNCICNRQPVARFVFVSSRPLWPMTIF
jgi:hypothetical protein